MTERTDRVPARPDDGVRLWASRWAWLSGLMWLGLAMVAVGAAIAAIVVIAESGRSRDSRGLMIIGLALGLPALTVLGRLSLDASRRLVRPRHGRIELAADRLVVHDRWMLRRPLEIHRSEIAEIRPLPRLRRWQYTGLAGAEGRELGALGPLLDWGTIPNCAITLREERRFVEAVRTLPSKTPLQPLSCTSVGTTLLLRLADPDHSLPELGTWMRSARSAHVPKRDVARGGCLAELETAVIYASGAVGFALFCIGAYVGASS